MINTAMNILTKEHCECLCKLLDGLDFCNIHASFAMQPLNWEGVFYSFHLYLRRFLGEHPRT